MFELLSHLSLGASVAASPLNMGLCLMGALIGTLIGVLPGIGPVATIALLLPITFGLPPTSALIMLAGIYYGSQYGGSTTAILVNLPGEAASVVTTLDGHQMARQGRAGAALAIAAIGSFLAGTFATLLIAAFAIPLAKLALVFTSYEYFALMVLGIVFAVVLANGAVHKALLMVGVGLVLSTVGTDLESGQQRLTFGWVPLFDGISFVPLAMGLFGFGEILMNLENRNNRELLTKPISSLMPTRSEMREARPAIVRGTLLGSLLGILPGGGSILASFASYTVEKQVSATPEKFGKGAICGVAGPESANNAAAQTSFIPLLTLGIPPNPVMALMLGAMIIHGIVPGPTIMTRQPELIWGLIVSMWLGNLMLLVINLPLVGIWVRLLKVPYRVLFPAIILFSCIGVYSIRASTFDVALMGIFTFLGYVLLKFRFEPAPLLLAFVLGPLMEENLRRGLLISRGDPMAFVTRPISGAILLFSVILLVMAILPTIRKRREEIFVE